MPVDTLHFGDLSARIALRGYIWFDFASLPRNFTARSLAGLGAFRRQPCYVIDSTKAMRLAASDVLFELAIDPKHDDQIGRNIA